MNDYIGYTKYSSYLGSAIGSSALAAILYQTSLGDFVYTTDGSGNAILDNQGSLGATNDGILYSGRGIELGATNDVDIPIHHTLGVEDFDRYFTQTAGAITVSSITNGFKISSVGGGSGSQSTLLYYLTNHTIGNVFKYTFNYSVISGSPIVVSMGNVSGFTGSTFAGTGQQNHTLTATSTNNYSYQYWDDTLAWEIDITFTSIKQITNPNSYLTYYDFINGFEYIDCSLLTPSTTYTLNTKTVNNILTHTTALPTADRTAIEANPNLLGKLALETTGVTKTISELTIALDQGASNDSYYMCSEKSGAYLVDSRVAYGLKNANVISSSQYTTGTGNSITPTGSYTWDIVNVVSGVTFAPNASINIDSASALIPHLWTAVVNITSGTAEVQQTTFGLLNETLTTGTYEYNYIAISSIFQLQFDSVAQTTFTATIELSCKQATAIEIANYAETVRTNADLQQKGIQQTAFVTDGAGVPTAYSSNLLQFNGDGRYVDTGWIPSATSDWSLEAVFINNDRGLELNGTFNATNTRVYYGSGTNGATLAYGVGSDAKLITTAVNINSYNHIVITYNGTTGQVTYYVNNTQTIQTTPTFVQPADSFYIGLRNRGSGTTDYPLYKPNGMFKVHNKLLDGTEVSTAYTDAKTIYPTLP